MISGHRLHAALPSWKYAPAFLANDARWQGVDDRWQNAHYSRGELAIGTIEMWTHVFCTCRRQAKDFDWLQWSSHRQNIWAGRYSFLKVFQHRLRTVKLDYT